MDEADGPGFTPPIGKRSATPRRRASERRDEIIQVAGGLFCDRGFTGVSMRDIAERLGLSDAALYRYFRSQREIHTAVMDHGLQGLMAQLHVIAPTDPFDQQLSRFLDATFATPRFSLLWHRDSKRLEKPDFERLSSKLIDYAKDLSQRLYATSQLSPWHCAVRAWWCVSAAAAVSLVRHSLPTPLFRELILSCLIAAAQTPPVEDPRPDPLAPQPRATENLLSGRGSRREALLDSALHMFSTTGFQGSTMEQIGAHADVSAAAIYLEFPSKDDLLYAVFERGNTRLQNEATDILRTNSDPRQALSQLVSSYSRITQHHLEHPEVLFRELHLLPRDLGALAHARQREYIAEWVRLLTMIRPGLEEPHARIIVGTAMIGIGDLARTPYLAHHPAFAAELDALTMNVLLTAGISIDTSGPGKPKEEVPRSR